MLLNVERHQQPVPLQESFFQPDEGVLFVSNLTYSAARQSHSHSRVSSHRSDSVFCTV